MHKEVGVKKGFNKGEIPENEKEMQFNEYTRNPEITE